MRAIEFYFTLDKTYLKGTDQSIIRKYKIQNLSITQYFNPEPTTIYLSCSAGGKYMKVNTGFKIKPVEWDFEKNRAKKKYQFSLELNASLDMIISNVKRGYFQLRQDNLDISADMIKTLIESVLGESSRKNQPKAPVTFWDVFNEYSEEKDQTVKKGTVKRINTVRKLLEEFEKKKYKLSFDRMTTQFLTEFGSFCVNDKMHLNNTIHKSISCLKAFLNWAAYHRNKYNKYDDYKRFSWETDNPEAIFLEQDELQLIWDCDVSHARSLQHSKDILLFLCYTGQRYSDVVNLKKGDIRKSNNSDDIIWHLYQIKGNKKTPVSIPMLPRAKVILEKYLNESPNAGFIFPKQSNVMLNKNIKVIGKKAGINATIYKVNHSGKNRITKDNPKYKFMSSHIGRRTFVTLSSQKGIRPEIIQKITGHTGLSVMKRYLGVNDNMVNNELKDKWKE